METYSLLSVLNIRTHDVSTLKPGQPPGLQSSALSLYLVRTIFLQQSPSPNQYGLLHGGSLLSLLPPFPWSLDQDARPSLLSRRFSSLMERLGWGSGFGTSPFTAVLAHFSQRRSTIHRSPSSKFFLHFRIFANPGHLVEMSPGNFKKPKPQPIPKRSGKIKKRKLSQEAISSFHIAMNLVLAVQDHPDSRATPWDTPGKTGITISFPKLRIDPLETGRDQAPQATGEAGQTSQTSSDSNHSDIRHLRHPPSCSQHANPLGLKFFGVDDDINVCVFRRLLLPRTRRSPKDSRRCCHPGRASSGGKLYICSG